MSWRAVRNSGKLSSDAVSCERGGSGGSSRTPKRDYLLRDGGVDEEVVERVVAGWREQEVVDRRRDMGDGGLGERVRV